MWWERVLDLGDEVGSQIIGMESPLAWGGEKDDVTVADSSQEWPTPRDTQSPFPWGLSHSGVKFPPLKQPPTPPPTRSFSQDIYVLSPCVYVGAGRVEKVSFKQPPTNTSNGLPVAFECDMEEEGTEGVRTACFFFLWWQCIHFFYAS